jgi:hypothetical protein
MFEVVLYEHPCIYVRRSQTGEVYDFEVGDDGALTHSETPTDEGDARRAAIAYLHRLDRGAAPQIPTALSRDMGVSTELAR